MTDYSKIETAELISLFIEGATRLGTVFNLPLKMDRNSPQGKILFGEMQLLGDELSARKPIAEIRPLYDHPNDDVRYWAALQFTRIDPEWASAVCDAVREHLTTGEVVSLVRRAQEPSTDLDPIMSVTQLVQRFEDASIRLYATEFMSDENGLPDIETHNRIKDEIFEIAHALETQHALQALLPFLHHSNRYVRHMAATVCLPVASSLAIPVLEAISQANDPPGEGMRAGLTLLLWGRKQAASEQ